MDQNKALAEMRAALARVTTRQDSYRRTVDLEDIAMRAKALDEWITQGGMLPTAWRGGDSDSDGEHPFTRARERRIVDGIDALHELGYVADRLEYLRGEIRAERISYGEIAELQSLADHIRPGDVELAEWAGIDEAEFARRR